jgi:hypothetical protein
MFTVNFPLGAPGYSSTFSRTTLHTCDIWGSNSGVAEDSWVLCHVCWSVITEASDDLIPWPSRSSNEDYITYSLQNLSQTPRIWLFRPVTAVIILTSKGVATRIYRTPKDNVTSDSSRSVLTLAPRTLLFSCNMMTLIHSCTIIWAGFSSCILPSLFRSRLCISCVPGCWWSGYSLRPAASFQVI